MIAPSGYLLCATPRTGSTLMCDLLRSTGVLGRPESYFREPDEAAWAARFGVPTSNGRVRDYATFVDAVRATATVNGIFGARIMWGSLDRIREGLAGTPDRSDRAALEDAFGRLAFVHLVREDVVAQAVSWARAEQSGYWQPGDAASDPAGPDPARMVELVETIRDHNAAWVSWFTTNGIEYEQLTYEELVDDPGHAVEAIAARLQISLPARWQPHSAHRKQADGTNEEWAAVLRAALRSEET